MLQSNIPLRHLVNPLHPFCAYSLCPVQGIWRCCSPSLVKSKPLSISKLQCGEEWSNSDQGSGTGQNKLSPAGAKRAQRNVLVTQLPSSCTRPSPGMGHFRAGKVEGGWVAPRTDRGILWAISAFLPWWPPTQAGLACHSEAQFKIHTPYCYWAMPLTTLSFQEYFLNPGRDFGFSVSQGHRVGQTVYCNSM